MLVHNLCKPNERKFTDEQQEVIKSAKNAKKNGGISRPDGEALANRAKQLGLNAHGPMIHPNRSGIWSYTEHIKILNMHIPII